MADALFRRWPKAPLVALWNPAAENVAADTRALNLGSRMLEHLVQTQIIVQHVAIVHARPHEGLLGLLITLAVLTLILAGVRLQVAAVDALRSVALHKQLRRNGQLA